MAKKKKHQHHDEHVDESWLIPYADLLTLLLALFIVLFASSTVDVQKYQAIASSFNNAFVGGTGIMDFENPVPEPAEPQPITDDKPTEEEKEKEEEEEKQKVAEQEELQELQEKINDYIFSNQLNSSLETQLTEDGLLVTLLNDTFFNSGSAEVRSEDVVLAREISQFLVMNPARNIIVSGHTDNVPIRNSQFDSNWHLSVIRSVNFMKILLENKELDPQKFSSKGYGEFQPVASNDTAEGRKQNRRVEILILPNN
ncbi:flagellar motor protein MotB [Bacillus sp. PS06]|uniref:flagellar motor protein MotB n=1 Tax=Bacillus sp. PS06 TaxID=2764176 RepID=UPI001783DF4F|nr:flagellar motor protein MotB [Bacillus sp. PS06]MBD8067427.1 flagellar motor protein MotB [Bacillus sp. PS06]